jgi:hypothetical protein
MTEQIYPQKLEQGKILNKLLDIQSKISAVEKEGYNEHGNYNFISDQQLTPMIKTLLEKHNVKFSPNSVDMIDARVNPKGNQLVYAVRVSYSFTDIDSGESYYGTMVGTGGDMTDKGIYKAITGAIKYIFIKHFLIPTQDDPENEKKAKGKGTKTIDDLDI